MKLISSLLGLFILELAIIVGCGWTPGGIQLDINIVGYHVWSTWTVGDCGLTVHDWGT